MGTTDVKFARSMTNCARFASADGTYSTWGNIGVDAIDSSLVHFSFAFVDYPSGATRTTIVKVSFTFVFFC